MRIKTRIAILNGELKTRVGVKDWPIKTDGRVEKGIVLTSGEHLPAALAKEWIALGKAVVEADVKATPTENPKP